MEAGPAQAVDVVDLVGHLRQAVDAARERRLAGIGRPRGNTDGPVATTEPEAERA
jgi:hypothetical protein